MAKIQIIGINYLLLPKINFANMKKAFVFAFLLGVITLGHAQPKIKNLTFSSSVKLFDLYEITFQLGTYANPYDPAVIDVYAEFTAPDGRISKVNGFYYEGYHFEKHNGYEKSYLDSRNSCWKVRFTPTQVGTWKFTLHAIDKQGRLTMSSYGGTTFVFTCKTVDNAKGFITKANTRYLKRDIVANGKRQSHSFFPIGPNVAWYVCKEYYNYASPYGIYEYERRIDSLAGNANYIRVFLDRPQSLSLYGPEHTQMKNGEPTVYFNNTINQKDAGELDHIIQYAAQNDINVMLCIFNYINLKADPAHDNSLDKDQDDWRINPYHTVLGLKKTDDFFTDAEAIRISQNHVRYIVARWGYATNLVAWELWNEVNNMDFDMNALDRYRNSVCRWHKDMADLIHNNDPFGHLVSTSLGSKDPDNYLYDHVFNSQDLVLYHRYFSVLEAKSKQQPAYQLHLQSANTRKIYPSLPFYVGEFGFGSLTTANYLANDPYGCDHHNTLWSSLFSGMMGPASFWNWTVLDKGKSHDIFKPVLNFCKQLPIPSETFTPYTTGEPKKFSIVFPNGIETYYMVNAAEDTLYGWSQDTAFTYQALRRLTDRVNAKSHFEEGAVFDPQGYVYTLNDKKKPRPSSRSNVISIPIEKQPAGTRYVVRWYDTETGKEIRSEATEAVVKNHALTFEFPSSIRDVRKKTISNTFGDAVFVITRENKNGSTPESNAANATKKIRIKKGTNRQ